MQPLPRLFIRQKLVFSSKRDLRCKWYDVVKSLQSVAKAMVRCEGKRTEQRKRRETLVHKLPHKLRKFFFLELDSSGCRSDFPSLPLPPSLFCRAKSNDVPCDKCWLTSCHQHSQAHRHRCVTPATYTPNVPEHLWPAAGSFASYVPLSWSRYGEQMWLFCLTGLEEENKSQTTGLGWV